MEAWNVVLLAFVAKRAKRYNGYKASPETKINNKLALC